MVNPLSESGRQIRTWAQLRLEAAVGGRARLPPGGGGSSPSRDGGQVRAGGGGGDRGGGGRDGGRGGEGGAGSDRLWQGSGSKAVPSRLGADGAATDDEQGGEYGQTSHLPVPQRLPAPPRAERHANPSERAVVADRSKMRTLGQRHQPAMQPQPVTHRSAAFEAMQLKYEDPPVGGYRYRTASPPALAVRVPTLAELQARYSPPPVRDALPPPTRTHTHGDLARPSGYVRVDDAADDYGA